MQSHGRVGGALTETRGAFSMSYSTIKPITERSTFLADLASKIMMALNRHNGDPTEAVIDFHHEWPDLTQCALEELFVDIFTLKGRWPDTMKILAVDKLLASAPGPNNA
jgi:hypothetical protein